MSFLPGTENFLVCIKKGYPCSARVKLDWFHGREELLCWLILASPGSNLVVVRTDQLCPSFHPRLDLLVLIQVVMTASGGDWLSGLLQAMRRMSSRPVSNQLSIYCTYKYRIDDEITRAFHLVLWDCISSEHTGPWAKWLSLTIHPTVFFQTTDWLHVDVYIPFKLQQTQSHPPWSGG